MVEALPLSDVSARAWCEQLVGSLARQQIGGRDGELYLDRYFAAGWSPFRRCPGPSLFLHHFVASDSREEVHSHPWDWSCSLILAGGYREIRCADDGSSVVREFRPGDVNVIVADDQHRIELLGDDCWTLFLAGNFEKGWGFSPTC